MNSLSYHTASFQKHASDTLYLPAPLEYGSSFPWIACVFCSLSIWSTEKGDGG